MFFIDCNVLWKQVNKCLYSFLGTFVRVFYVPNLLHECSRHLTAVFPHTLWLAPLTALGNVCLLSLASLHLEHAPGKTAWSVRHQARGNQLCICSVRSHAYGSVICVVIEKPELWYQPSSPQPLLLSTFQAVIDDLRNRDDQSFVLVVHSITSACAHFACI